jgi:hypothetical protein
MVSFILWAKDSGRSVDLLMQFSEVRALSNLACFSALAMMNFQNFFLVGSIDEGLVFFLVWHKLTFWVIFALGMESSPTTATNFIQLGLN